MHRFFCPPQQARDSVIVLTGAEAHHALHVARVRANERVVVLDGAGHELLCEPERFERDSLSLRVLQRNYTPPLPCTVTLAQALMKAKTMDLIVQKATELGVHRIVPILSERSVSQIEADTVAAKLEKWRATMVEAVKQCGSPWLPQVDPPLAPQTFLTQGDRSELTLIASLERDAAHPRQHFRNFAEERKRLPKSVCVWVGPEGDFTPAEINAIRQTGALPITLGRLILRSETAAIYCLSVLNYELQTPALLSAAG